MKFLRPGPAALTALLLLIVVGTDSRTLTPRIKEDKASKRNVALPLPSNSDRIMVRRDYSLEPRDPPFTNLLRGYHMTWDRMLAIQPSIQAAHALITLFSTLRNAVRDIWSKQPPRNRIDIKYGSITISIYCPHGTISWAVVMDLLEKTLAEMKRGLIGFFRTRVTLKGVNNAGIVLAMTLTGVMVARAGLPNAEAGDGFLRNIIG
ncbi:MAG: hypothetical protein L6R39_006184 [Caloplaca ligustica]|nr:MAG: hypothetical protein L6R39_006184 [Caloplaca ligustica]